MCCEHEGCPPVLPQDVHALEATVEYAPCIAINICLDGAVRFQALAQGVGDGRFHNVSSLEGQGGP